MSIFSALPCPVYALVVAVLICALVAVWLRRKANMTPAQGIILFAGGMPGTLLAVAIQAAGVLDSCVLAISMGTVAGVASQVIFVLFRFYRDPDRKCPQEPGLFMSPADGRVLYVRQARAGTIPNAIKGRSHIQLEELAGTDLELTDAWVIGIGMTILDVHVNRAPLAGQVMASVHTAGRFLSLKDPKSLTANERNTVIIKTAVGPVAVVQIASKQVRRIRSRVRAEDRVRTGQRIGSILFGSQVDLILPSRGTNVCVYEGQQLTAGLSIVAVMT